MLLLPRLSLLFFNISALHRGRRQNVGINADNGSGALRQGTYARTSYVFRYSVTDSTTRCCVHCYYFSTYLSSYNLGRVQDADGSIFYPQTVSSCLGCCLVSQYGCMAPATKTKSEWKRKCPPPKKNKSVSNHAWVREIDSHYMARSAATNKSSRERVDHESDYWTPKTPSPPLFPPTSVCMHAWVHKIGSRHLPDGQRRPTNEPTSFSQNKNSQLGKGVEFNSSWWRRVARIVTVPENKKSLYIENSNNNKSRIFVRWRVNIEI